MANFNAKNYKLANVDKPSAKIAPGDVNGEIKFCYDEYTFVAAAFTLSDVIKTSLKVPRGARILDAGILCPALTAGAFSLGRAAVGGNAAVPASLIAATSFASAALARPSAAAVDLVVEMDQDEVPFDLTCTTAVTAGNGLTIKTWIMYSDV